MSSIGPCHISCPVKCFSFSILYLSLVFFPIMVINWTNALIALTIVNQFRTSIFIFFCRSHDIEVNQLNFLVYNSSENYVSKDVNNL